MSDCPSGDFKYLINTLCISNPDLNPYVIVITTMILASMVYLLKMSQRKIKEITEGKPNVSAPWD